MTSSSPNDSGRSPADAARALHTFLDFEPEAREAFLDQHPNARASLDATIALSKQDNVQPSSLLEKLADFLSVWRPPAPLGALEGATLGSLRRDPPKGQNPYDDDLDRIINLMLGSHPVAPRPTADPAEDDARGSAS